MSALFERLSQVTVQPSDFVGHGSTRRLNVRAWANIDPYPGFSPMANLRTVFSVSKSIEPEPNTAKIDLYNLNAENRARLRKNDLITLRAGYVGQVSGDDRDQLPLIYRGNITRIVQRRERADWVTKISCGTTASKQAYINDLVPGGASITESVEKLQERLGELGVEVMSSFNQSVLRWVTQQFNRQSSNPDSEGTDAGGIVGTISTKSRALVGKVTDLLNDELGRVGLQASVQDNVLIVRPRGGNDGQTSILISPQTGLVGSIGPTETGGVQGRCLLIPGVTPGRSVDVQSKVLGDAPLPYVVTKARFGGDTHGSPWYIDFEAEEQGTRIAL